MPHHEKLCVRVENGRFVFESRDEILKRWYDRLAAAIPPGISLSEELIRERRREAAREMEDDEVPPASEL